MYDHIVSVTESSCEYLEARICPVRRMEHLDLYIDKRDISTEFLDSLNSKSNKFELVLIDDIREYVLLYIDPEIIDTKNIGDEFIISVKGQPKKLQSKDEISSWLHSLPGADI